VRRGLHPSTLLVGDRGGAAVLDPRSSSLTQLAMKMKHCELVRGVEEGRRPHLVTTTTDTRLLMHDLRQPLVPLLEIRQEVGALGRTPVAGVARGEVGEQDWCLVYNRWGDMAVTVVDWGHSSCSSCASSLHHTSVHSSSLHSSLHPCPPEEQVAVVCGEGPSILGRDSTVVEGWSTTVTRARSLAGCWLDTPVEERVEVPFTGAALVAEAGGATIYLANPLGDLFAKHWSRDHVEEEDRRRRWRGGRRCGWRSGGRRWWIEHSSPASP